MPRVVIATLGSLGDLHPAIAIALELQRRGHHLILATSETYRDRIRALGLEFHPLRPDLLAAGEHVVAEIMDGSRGTERLMKHRIIPAVGDMYQDLEPIAVKADLLVTSELVFAAKLLAEKRGCRWVCYFLAPVSLFSTIDPPVLPLPAGLRWLPQLGPPALRFIKAVGKLVSYSWWRPVRRLRRELGLAPAAHPLFEGKYSSLLNLALFSPVLQPAQRDWPANLIQAGFCFFDEGTPALPPAVDAFLRAGEPPIVFTLGSAAVYMAQNFYAESARAAQQLGRRALLLLGHNPAPAELPLSILAWDYLPYAQIFPHAAALVHQGGVGTTAQALRAGRPMLVVPFAHDQFDNAARVTRLGVARTLSRTEYRASRVAKELSALLNDAGYAREAAEIAPAVRSGRGTAATCDALESVLARRDGC